MGRGVHAGGVVRIVTWTFKVEVNSMYIISQF